MTFDVLLTDGPDLFDSDAEIVRINDLDIDEVEALARIVQPRGISMVAYINLEN